MLLVMIESILYKPDIITDKKSANNALHGKTRAGRLWNIVLGYKSSHMTLKRVLTKEEKEGDMMKPSTR